MSRRTKIIVGILTVVLLIIVALLLWWWFNRPQPSPDGEPTLTNVPPGLEVPATLPAGSGGTETPPGMPKEVSDLQSTLKAIAFTFAERFGSYSNEVYFSNLDDVQDLMTAKMKAWADSYRADNPPGDDGEYYGISTKAIAAEVMSFDQSLRRAEVEVNTQRQESRISSSNPRAFYQMLTLSMVEVNGSWKIDAAEWQ